MKNRVLIMGLFVLLAALSPLALAQEEEEIDYTFGEVTKVMENQITLNEYDFDSDAFRDFVYEVNEETELDNISGITDLQIGETLELDFVTRGDKRIAVYLASAEIAEDEEIELFEESAEEEEEIQLVS